MADSQYDASEKLQRLYHEKQKIRQAVRESVLRRQTNPHLGFGSAMYDNAIIRYHALWSYRSQHVYANTRNVGVIICFFLVPVGVLFYSNRKNHHDREKLFRSGQIAYEDRNCKEFL